MALGFLNLLLKNSPFKYGISNIYTVEYRKRMCRNNIKGHART